VNESPWALYTLRALATFKRLILIYNSLLGGYIRKSGCSVLRVYICNPLLNAPTIAAEWRRRRVGGGEKKGAVAGNERILNTRYSSQDYQVLPIIQ